MKTEGIPEELKKSEEPGFEDRKVIQTFISVDTQLAVLPPYASSEMTHGKSALRMRLLNSKQEVQDLPNPQLTFRVLKIRSPKLYDESVESVDLAGSRYKCHS